MTARKLPKIEYNGYLCGTKKTAMRILNALLTAMLLTAAVAHGQNADPRPCSMRDVWRAYEAFDAAFLDPDKQIYKTDTSFPRATDRFNGAAAIWCQPIYWNMAMDACKAAEHRGRKRRARRYEESARRIFEGQKAHYAGFDFDDNNENTGWFIYDDIMWWTISLARAYDLFGDEEYLRLSEESFRRVWHGSAKVGDTGSYDKERGGMFWRWYPIRNPEPNRSGDGKMACINFPTTVAAVLLARNVPADRIAGGEYPTRDEYLAKGREIYEWGEKNLFDPATGRVADSRHGDGEPAWKTHVYNQATFIGASVLLYRATGDRRCLDHAGKAADHTVGAMSAEHGLLPFEDGIEQGIYTAIFAQYMALLVDDCGQRQYLPFIRRNIAAGWANRDASRDICGGESWRPLGSDETVDSYSASGIPALMLAFPPEK